MLCFLCLCWDIAAVGCGHCLGEYHGLIVEANKNDFEKTETTKLIKKQKRMCEGIFKGDDNSRHDR